jgi:hypothetical protein
MQVFSFDADILLKHVEFIPGFPLLVLDSLPHPKKSKLSCVTKFVP